jgi:DNA-binding CsgD family transcriptional regulator
MIDFTVPQLNARRLQIPGIDFLSLLSLEHESFTFIKNKSSVYQYANRSFMELMGIKNIYNQTDYDLCRDKKKIKIYQQHDEQVFEAEQVLSVSEEILPQKNQLIKTQMVGKLYPIYAEDSTPVAVLGIVKPQYLPFKLTIEIAVCLTKEEIDELFTKRSYPIVVHNQTITLSKREIQCIIELVKGKHAGEIAHTLQLKQTTIEFYTENLKNKLGATSKSSLLLTVFTQKIIQQIVL